jgi:pimeloyl-ACP methyl ester carboxylesterase
VTRRLRGGYPETRYAKSGDLHVAYQLVGDAPLDLVLLTQWFSHVDGLWDVPPLAEFVDRLTSFSRVLTFDKRGTGLSDPVPIHSLPSIEEWMDDLRAVMDDSGIERAAIVANLASGFMATLFAATHPARVSALVLVNVCPRFTSASDYPWGTGPEQTRQLLEDAPRMWGRGMLVQMFAPSVAHDAAIIDAVSRYERQAASPGTARAMVEMINHTDIRSALPTVSAPTLLIARGPVPRDSPQHSRYVADHIAHARYVVVPGEDQLMWAGDQERLVARSRSSSPGHARRSRGIACWRPCSSQTSSDPRSGRRTSAIELGARCSTGIMRRYARN